MGQGKSSKGAGTGLSGAGVGDGTLVLDCVVTGPVGALPNGVTGSGLLRRSGTNVVVVDGGKRLAVCDPSDPTTAKLERCIGHGFRYSAEVIVAPSGATSVDVATIS